MPARGTSRARRDSALEKRLPPLRPFCSPQEKVSLCPSSASPGRLRSPRPMLWASLCSRRNCVCTRPSARLDYQLRSSGHSAQPMGGRTQAKSTTSRVGARKREIISTLSADRLAHRCNASCLITPRSPAFGLIAPFALSLAPASRTKLRAIFQRRVRDGRRGSQQWVAAEAISDQSNALLRASEPSPPEKKHLRWVARTGGAVASC